MDASLLEQVVAYTVDEVSIKNFYEFRVPPTSVVGDGISSRLGQYLQQLGVRSALIVTDAVIVRLGLLAPMLRSLERAGVAHQIFDDVTPDPTSAVVQAGIDALHRSGCQAVLTIGGGSAIDAGKAVAVFAANPRPFDLAITPETALQPRLPLVAVPTTAGTGSEVTMVSVITDQPSHRKLPHTHPLFIPDVALIDPCLTLGIPPAITAATGIDVLTHAVESFLARGVCTLGRALSYNAIQLVSANLRRAVGDGGHLESRHRMATASYMAGMAFSNAGLGLCHAMAHQLGARYNLPHGLANGLLLPEVMRFNMLVRQERLVEIAHAFNQQVDNLPPREAALRSIDAVRLLIEEIGLPTRLSQVGVREIDFVDMARQVLEDPTLQNNPRTAAAEDIVRVFQGSF
ncbi:MAG: iron-containing alcohol dehydrogenase family protein [Chloroflexota bacterium]